MRETGDVQLDLATSANAGRAVPTTSAADHDLRMFKAFCDGDLVRLQRCDLGTCDFVHFRQTEGRARFSHSVYVVGAIQEDVLFKESLAHCRSTRTRTK